MSEKREMGKQIFRWLIVAAFVVFAVPTLIGFIIIERQQAAAHKQYMRPDSSAAPVTVPPAKGTIPTGARP